MEYKRDMTIKLPQKFPFLFIDKIVKLEKEKQIIAIKNITSGDFHLQGGGGKRNLYFTLELMGQVAELLVRESYCIKNEKLVLASIDSLTISSDFDIGDNIIIKSTLNTVVMKFYKSEVIIVKDNCEIVKGFFIHSVKTPDKGL